LSAYVRGLFLRYPETTFEDIFADTSYPVGSLSRLSWALHNISDKDFDPEKALHLLTHVDLLHWSAMYQRVLSKDDEPLKIVQGFIDLYIEVDTAVNKIAQAMNAAMEALVHPYVVHSPIVLSGAEYTRIACAIYVLKIYYQLRLKFFHAGHDWRSRFPETYLKGLKPWQVDQALCIEQFYHICQNGGKFQDMFGIIDREYTCKVCLSETSSFFRNYAKALRPSVEFNPGSFSFPKDFKCAVNDLRRRPTNSLIPPPWHYDLEAIGHPSHISPIPTQLRNYGWTVFNAVFIDEEGEDRTLVNWQFRHVMPSLGILFWDQDRLTSWEIVSSNDLVDAFRTLDRRVREETIRKRNKQNRSKYCPPGSERVDVSKARQIIEWTRQPVQCSLEEWLYQRTALVRIEEGRPLMPGKYIEPGAVCQWCGLDGHESRWCNEWSWVEDDGERGKFEQ
jgi:hypothetical protein